MGLQVGEYISNLVITPQMTENGAGGGGDEVHPFLL